MTHKCDADRVLRAFGETTVNHSSDIFPIWHGMDTPAYSCGKHAQGLGLLNVFRGHRARMGEANTITVVTTDGSYEVIVPTD